MSTTDEQWLFVQDKAKLILFAKSIGVKLTDGEAWRPQFVQDKYHAEGKSKKVHSLHSSRLAQDYNIFVKDEDNKWTWLAGKDYTKYQSTAQRLGNYWESLNIKNMWGGNYPKYFGGKFVDSPHFERRKEARKEV